MSVLTRRGIYAFGPVPYPSVPLDCLPPQSDPYLQNGSAKETGKFWQSGPSLSYYCTLWHVSYMPC